MDNRYSVVIIFWIPGDFTSDYKNYVFLFDLYNQFSFNQLFINQFGQEIGFVIFNRVIGIFTDNSVFIMLITSFVIIYLFLKEIKKDSVYVWLSVLLFVAIGQYYISFNLIRQILAVSIIFAGSKYLYEKKIMKYLMVILIASLFHKTSFIMVPFFFILNYKFSFKKVLLTLSFLLLSTIYIDKLLSIIQNYFYTHYIEGSYGMVGFSYKNIVLPLTMLFIMLLNLSNIDYKNNRKVNIWTNSVIFYVFFSIMGMKVEVIERISHFFAPYVLLLIPYIISKHRNPYIRIVFIFAIVTVSIAYNYFGLNGTGFNPFYFIWSFK